MDKVYKIRKGLDLRLEGEAEKTLRATLKAERYAVSPAGFYGLVPRLQVKAGDHVRAGDALFVDKADERVCVVSPVSGTVEEIARGDRRKLLYVSVRPDQVQDIKERPRLDLQKASGEDVKALLLEAGLFAFFRQRPYDVVASPKDTPKAIFVSAFSKMPLAADFTHVAEGQEAEFKAGIKALAKMAPVYVGISPEQKSAAFVPTEDAEVNVFDGPNPSGNVGVQINHVAPVNKGEVVWTLGAEEVIFVGRLILTGRTNLMRRIAVAGSEIEHPAYVDARIGTPLKCILGDELKRSEHVRIIEGNPLVGTKSSVDGYLGAHTTEICALPEGDDVDEAFGWMAPRLKDFSTSRSYFSWLQGKQKRYNLDCRVKGGERHMIMSAEYERVFPMDIYPSYLIKAIITGDIDRQEALGIYEVAPEDFAVAEFIDSSKLELQRIVREGLDKLKKENS